MFVMFIKLYIFIGCCIALNSLRLMRRERVEFKCNSVLVTLFNTFETILLWPVNVIALVVLLKKYPEKIREINEDMFEPIEDESKDEQS